MYDIPRVVGCSIPRWYIPRVVGCSIPRWCIPGYPKVYLRVVYTWVSLGCTTGWCIYPGIPWWEVYPAVYTLLYHPGYTYPAVYSRVHRHPHPGVSREEALGSTLGLIRENVAHIASLSSKV